MLCLPSVRRTLAVAPGSSEAEGLVHYSLGPIGLRCAGLCKSSAIEGHGRLADAAFLICDCDCVLIAPFRPQILLCALCMV